MKNTPAKVESSQEINQFEISSYLNGKRAEISSISSKIITKTLERIEKLKDGLNFIQKTSKKIDKIYKSIDDGTTNDSIMIGGRWILYNIECESIEKLYEKIEEGVENKRLKLNRAIDSLWNLIEAPYEYQACCDQMPIKRMPEEINEENADKIGIPRKISKTEGNVIESSTTKLESKEITIKNNFTPARSYCQNESKKFDEESKYEFAKETSPSLNDKSVNQDSPQKSQRASLFEWDKLSFFNNNQDLSVYYLSTNEIKTTEVELYENISKNISMCVIPDEKVFCYGSCSNGVFSGITFEIWFNNGAFDRIKNLSPGYPCLGAGIAYNNNYIYAFGGSSSFGETDHASKYSLIDNCWTDIPTLPQTASNYSCFGFGNKIFLSGKTCKNLYCYFISRNIYDVVFNKLHESRTKILFAHQSRIFLIEWGGKMYSSKNGKEWDTFGKCTYKGNEELFSYQIISKKSVFFACGNKIYEFSLASRSIKDRMEIP